MRMEEGENIGQYVTRIKEVVNGIRGVVGKIDDGIVLSNVLRILLPIYAIRFFVLQELRCIQGNDLSLEVLVGRLTTFELSNFDNYKPEKIESPFKSKVSLKEPNETKKKKKKKYVCNDSDTDEEDVEQLEALLARRFRKGKGKFKGKLPIIFFNCNEVGHIATRCT